MLFPLCEPFLKRGCTRETCSYTHVTICDEAVRDRLREKPWLLCSQWAFGKCTSVPCPQGKEHPVELEVIRPARVLAPAPHKQSSATQPKERAVSGGLSWVAMDYLAMDLKGDNAQNAYLNALLHGELATVGVRLLALAREEECCHQFLNHKTLKKELSEALSALRLVALALEKLDQRGRGDDKHIEADSSSSTSSSVHTSGSASTVVVCSECTADGSGGAVADDDDDVSRTVGESVSFTGLQHNSGDSGGGDRKLCIIDVCSGKGFFAAVCALALPNTSAAEVCMVDSDPKMVLRHLEARLFQRVSFHPFDVHSEAFAAWLLEKCASAVAQGAVPVVVGLHLCGGLSTRLTSLFNALPPAHQAVLVLSPCCLPYDDHSARDQCRARDLDPYAYWCRLVFGSLALGFGQQRGLVSDEHVLSPKSTLIWSIKALADTS